MTRARIVSFLRRYLEEKDFLEVETPILNAQAGGALAKPFRTRLDAMHQDLELRIAPELFLKQLIIGGFERVFEIGKVFRNEGIDKTHNPEFTSLEFYLAYADYQDLISLTEDMLRSLALHIHNTQKVKVPIFDIEAKTITKGPNKSETESRRLEIDFEGNFIKYDVMEELGLDPRDLGNLDVLRPKLR